MTTEKSKKEYRADLKEIRAQRAKVNSEIRTFKKEHETDNPKKVKDADAKAELEGLLEQLAGFDSQLEEIKGKMESAATNREKYAYPMITDNDTKKERELTSIEKKRWRNHARKEAAKAGCGPEEIVFDPDFFAPKVKVEKKTKEEKKAEKEAVKSVKTETEAAAKPVKKILRKREED
jgi:hypothetical protein